jgi:hypothetical protein
VTPDCVAKNNLQGYKKALSKENQELSRGVSLALLKLNKSISQAEYKHSPKALDKYSINSLKRRKRLNNLPFFF